MTQNIPTMPGFPGAPTQGFYDAQDAAGDDMPDLSAMTGALAGAGIDISRLNPESIMRALEAFGASADREGEDKKSGKYCYWSKPQTLPDGSPSPDAGFITIGPAWPVESARQFEKGMRKLTRYGEFPLRNVRERWFVSSEPYRRLFQLGGAHEVPVAQVIEHGWHRKPPYQGIVFPQLRGTVFTDVQCAHPGCGRWFTSEELLKKHEGVMHAAASSNDQLARALSKAGDGNAAALSQAVSIMGEQMQQFGGALSAVLQQNQLVMQHLGLTGALAPVVPPAAASTEQAAPTQAAPTQPTRPAVPPSSLTSTSTARPGRGAPRPDRTER